MEMKLGSRKSQSDAERFERNLVVLDERLLQSGIRVFKIPFWILKAGPSFKMLAVSTPSSDKSN
jgi:hypothetical protein